MSYNINLVPNIAPQGTVMQYASPIGATDPSGWVICDGLSRSNDSGFYNNILTSQLANVANLNTTPLNSKVSLLQNQNFSRVALNGDGTILFTVIYSENMYLSYNSGNIWNQIINSNGSQLGLGLAMSNNGNVIAYTGYISGKINVSTNSGVSFKTGPTNTYANVGGSILMSGDGSFMLALTEEAGTYISTNSGSTWSLIGTETNLPASTYGKGLSISNGLSPSGYYVAIFGNSLELYLTTNTGNWWSNVAPIAGKTWYTTATSGSGKFMIAGSNEYLYLSSNTGTNWIVLNSAIYGSIPTTTKIWAITSMNFDGNYMIAGNKTDSSVYVSSNYGNWWTTIQFPTTFSVSVVGSNLRMSPFGSNVFVCNNVDIFLSTNYGYFWTKLGYANARNPNFIPITSNWGNNGSSGSGNPVAVSQNGQIMAAVSNSTGGVYVSTNSGNNWINYNTGSISNSTSTGMTCVAMNSTGSTMVTTFNSLVHISTNTGVFWTEMTCPASSYNSIGISGDGTKIIVSGHASPLNHFTTNSGNSWILITNTMLPGAVSGYFNNTCAINQTGNVMVMCLQNVGQQALFISTNSGTSWFNTLQVGINISVGISNSGANIIYANVYTAQTGTWLSTNYGVNFKNLFTNGVACSMSGDGTIMAVAFKNGNISLSTDSGKSWTSITTNLGNLNWDAVQLSNDGTKILAAVYGGKLFVSNQAFSLSTYFSSFTPMNIANTTTTDGTTLKSIVKY